MGVKKRMSGTPWTNTASSYSTYVWSGATVSLSTSWNTSWTITPREELDETQVKALKHILTLATADESELTDIADSLAAATGDTPEESLKVLRTLRALVLLGQLTEKLAR